MILFYCKYHCHSFFSLTWDKQTTKSKYYAVKHAWVWVYNKFKMFVIYATSTVGCLLECLGYTIANKGNMRNGKNLFCTLLPHIGQREPQWSAKRHEFDLRLFTSPLHWWVNKILMLVAWWAVKQLNTVQPMISCLKWIKGWLQFFLTKTSFIYFFMFTILHLHGNLCELI